MCSMVWLVGAKSTYGMPSLAVEILGVVRLFAGDMSYLRLACSGLSNYVYTLVLNVAGKHNFP